MRRRIAASTLALAFGIAIASPGLSSPAIAAPAKPAKDNSSSQSAAQPPLVNEQLVTAALDPSGLPTQAELINRIVATNVAPQQVTAESSTIKIRYLDERGAPTISGNKVTYEVGGPGQTSSASQATFDKPLPVALHAEYATSGAGAKGIDPASVAGLGSEMTVRYTVTNTSVEKQTISYKDAVGNVTSEVQPVFAPFVGTLVATLAPGVALVNAPTAVVSTTADGNTALLWNLVLYPPLGDYEQELVFQVKSDALAVPAVKMEVVPVTQKQDPAVDFSGELLSESVSGNTELASGLTSLDDSTIKLADGMAKLSQGQSEQASGTEKAYTGSKELEAGVAKLSTGIGSIADGLAQLTGPKGLPKAVTASNDLAAAVRQIAAAVGSPADPSIPFPFTSSSLDDLSLYQVVRALGKGSAAMTAVATTIARSLAADAAAAKATGTTAEGAATNAAAAVVAIEAAQLEQSCASVASATCTALALARTEATAAATKATAAGVGAVAVAADLQLQATKAEDLAKGLTVMTAALAKVETGLAQVSAALQSNNTASPGVYEGQVALSAGLTESVVALEVLSAGADTATLGSKQLTVASDQLAIGLGTLDDGASQLSSGSADLAAGANELQADGTSKILNSVIESSDKPGQANAYLQAASARAGKAAPYPTPEGAVSRVAYVYSLTPPEPEPSGSPAALAIGVIFAVALALLAIRRIRRPVTT